MFHWPQALDLIAAHADDVDHHSRWPAESLAALTACGAMTWAADRSDGGAAMNEVELHQRYQQLASVCLTTALAWTQRDSAIGFLRGAAPTPFISQLLADLAQSKTFATIGIAQLTTSRQHLPPAVRATEAPDGWRLTGTIPWVTSAHHAEWVTTGAVTDHAIENQLLVALNLKTPGVEVGPPMQLAALTGSDTAVITLHDVRVPHEHVLSGPCPYALAGRDLGRSRFALTTCVMPLGVAVGALRHARTLLVGRSEACTRAIDQLDAALADLSRQVYDIGAHPAPHPMNDLAPQLRAQANVLALKSAAAALELAKGHGFLAGAPAQRRMREATFFCVWSTPAPVLEKTLEALAQP